MADAGGLLHLEDPPFDPATAAVVVCGRRIGTTPSLSSSSSLRPNAQRGNKRGGEKGKELVGGSFVPSWSCVHTRGF